MYWLCDSGGNPSHRRVTLEVKRNGMPTKVRTYHHVTRMGSDHDLGVYNNEVSSVEQALVERYLLVKIGDQYLPPLETKEASWKTKALNAFLEGVVSHVKPDATVLSLPQVVNRYTGAKRNVYANALRSLNRQGLCRKDAELRPFTKFEKQCLLKAPRIINPRSPRYNLVLGKYLKCAEKLYYKGINRMWGGHTPHTVIKGLNSTEAAGVLRKKWDRFKRPVAVGLDASKFDMHVSVNALRFEHQFYNNVFKTFELRRLLSWQLYNRGKAYCGDGTVTFRVPGTRCSGDLNTSLGNCIIMCALIWAMCAELGIEAELANNGDDCVLIMEQENLQMVLEAVPAFFERYGFRMTVEKPVTEFEEIEFCQSHPVHLGVGWTMVRNVRTCLQKDPMCLMPIQNDKVWRKWLGAVGECGLATVPGCPILQDFYGCFWRNGVGAGQRFKSAVFRNTSMIERGTGMRAESVITPEARVSFYKAFGVPPDYQMAVEDYYRKVTIGGIVDCDVTVGLVSNAPPAFLRHL